MFVLLHFDFSGLQEDKWKFALHLHQKIYFKGMAGTKG